MEKVNVTCPNCGKDFEVDVNATRGKCPHCKISIIFENVEEKHAENKPKPEVGKQRRRKGVLEEKVNISYIERFVDSISGEFSPSPSKISDIAVIDLIEEESGETDIEKKVDKILKTRG